MYLVNNITEKNINQWLFCVDSNNRTTHNETKKNNKQTNKTPKLKSSHDIVILN